MAFFDLGRAKVSLLWLPGTGGGFILYGRGVNAQFWHNDSEHAKIKSAGLVTIVTGFVGASLYLCPGSHHFVFHPDDVKESLAQKLMMKENILLQTKAS